MSQRYPFIINPDGSQSPNPNYRGPRSYNRSAKANGVNAKPPKQSILGKVSTKTSGVLGPVFRGMDVVNVMNPELSDKERGHSALGVINPALGFVTGSVLQPFHDWLSRVTDTEGAIYQGRGAGRASFNRAREQRVLNDVKSKEVIGQSPVPEQEFDSGRNTEPPNPNPNVPQKGTSMGSSALAPPKKKEFSDIRGSITPGSPIPAPTNNSGERAHEYEKEWQKSKKSVNGNVSKAEVPSLDKSYGSMSRQEMMDAYDRMRYGDNFDKAREAMAKAKGNPFDSTNNPAKFLVNEEGQKKAVKQGIEMNKHFFAPGGGREREINNRSAAPSLSDISTSNKGDGRAAFATSSQKTKDDAAKAGTLKPITDALGRVTSWLTGSSSSSRSKGVMTKDQIRELAVQTGFSPEKANVVVGIAGGESSYDPTNDTKRLGSKGLYATTGEDSVGLMQINWGYHKDRGWLQKLGITKREDLYDPVKNMRAAKYLHDQYGDFRDWTVYDKGIYKDYM